MFKSLLAAAALCSVAPAFAAANLLTDGSFESAVLPDGDYGMYGGSSLYGWTAVGSGLIEVRRDIVGTAQDGDYFVELDSTANSAMSQTISTVAGQRYSLSFWYSNRPASLSYNSVFPGGVAPASTNGLSFDVGSGAVNVPGLPANTSAVPAATHTVNGSPRIHTPMRMVDKGPTMPVCAVVPAPTRSMAIITMSTGAAVHSVAFRMDSQTTSGATTAALRGRSNTNCNRHSRHATEVARPTSRSEPRRRTISPL